MRNDKGQFIPGAEETKELGSKGGKAKVPKGPYYLEYLKETDPEAYLKVRQNYINAAKAREAKKREAKNEQTT